MSATASSSSDLVQSTRQQLDELDALLERMLELPVDADSKPSRPAPAPQSAPTPRASKPAAATSSPTPSKGETEAVLSWLRSGRETEQRPTPAPTPSPPPTEEADDDWVPLKSAWQPSAQTWGPLAKSWREANENEGSSPPTPAPESQVPTVETPMLPPPPMPQPPSVPIHEMAHGATETPEEEQEEINATLADALARLQTSEAQDQLVLEDSEAALAFWWMPMVWVNRAFDASTMPLGPLGRWLRGPLGREILAWAGGLALVAAFGLLTIDSFGWTW